MVLVLIPVKNKMESVYAIQKIVQHLTMERQNLFQN